MENLKKRYWAIISATRKGGKISQSIKDKEETYWSQFPENIIKAALEVHIEKYYSYRESYTRGIMRNMLKQQEAGRRIGKQVKENKFNNFETHNYSKEDLAVLERELLGF